MFLDEPTSGLDSFSAYNLVKLLKKVAATNCTILCTIHQPSSEVFFLFDKVIFMKDGRIFYQGPVDDVVSYFENLGHPCPENYNPSDFVMSLSQSLTAEQLDKQGLFMAIPEKCLEEARESTKQEALPDFQIESSFYKQVTQLTYREFMNSRRDVAALASRFGITVLMNLLFGLIFLNVGSKGNENNKDFNAHVGALSMATIFSLFGSAQQVMLTFPFERPMFLREYATGTCKAPIFILFPLITLNNFILF